MRSLLTLGLLAFPAAVAAQRTGAPARSRAPARYDIAYLFDAKDPATHLAEVRLRVRGQLGDTTRLQLPAWYPGRYAIYNFAANVQEAHAACDGRSVPSPKRDKQTWAVHCPASGGHAATLEFSLRVWWDDLSGSLTQIDSLHVNVNPGTVFPYVVDHKPDSVTVTYTGPSGWSVMNGAVASPWPGPVTLGFPNYDVFIDHPTEISARFTVDTFTVGHVSYRVVLHAEGSAPAEVRARLVHDLQQIVTAEVAVWGDPPIERYTFLVHYIPGNRDGGDGMEHLTSTQIIHPIALGDTATYQRRLESFAHEFFHTWSMKRLRARELGPWDYTRENYTPTLWFGEGFTNYYGARSVYRAGLWDRARYLGRVADGIAQLQSTPGRLVMSAEDASLSAWLFDAVPLWQQTRLRDNTISYYTKGEAIAWMLDLEIRARTAGEKTLDDVMRLMWQRFWNGTTTSYYLQGHGYGDADVLQAATEVSGSDCSEFFRRFVSGVEELPYGTTLAKVGLQLVTDAGTNRYRIEVDPDAPEAARQLGEAWLAGR